MSIAIWQILGGVLQLLLGRRIFWLMVGIAGFLIGLFVTMSVLDMPTWLKLIVGLIVGVVFGLLARLLPKPMAAIFGFFALGMVAALVATMFGAEMRSPVVWIAFLIGGIIGAILVFAVFDWGLIISSSLAGAGSIIAGLAVLLNFPARGWLGIILFVVLAIIGIAYQSKFIKS